MAMKNENEQFAALITSKGQEVAGAKMAPYLATIKSILDEIVVDADGDKANLLLEYIEKCMHLLFMDGALYNGHSQKLIDKELLRRIRGGQQ
jgi:hypothetical protein